MKAIATHKPYLLIAFIFLLPRLLFAIPADVEDLSNRAYFPALLKAIQTAQKSVHACLYYISYNQNPKSQVHQLLTALVDAKQRNVDVQIILDRSFESAGTSDMSKKNVQAFSYLKHNSIPVFYDDIETLTHAKYWIIDEKTVIVGSFNLSETSLTKNRETAALIRSPELASQYEKHFQDTPKFTPEPVKDAIPIPRELIRNKKMIAAMIQTSPKALDFYLLAQKLSFEQKSQTVILTRQQILTEMFDNQPLKKLEQYDPLTFAKNQYVNKYKEKSTTSW